MCLPRKLLLLFSLRRLQTAVRHPCHLQDDAGAVTGATCKLGWETGSRTALAVSRAISQFGVAHANSAGEPAMHSPGLARRRCRDPSFPRRLLAARPWRRTSKQQHCLRLANLNLILLFCAPVPFRHHPAAVETFEVQPEQCLVELTLRLQAAAAGRVDVLETALVQLLDAL